MSSRQLSSQDSSRKRFLDDLNKISILSGRENDGYSSHSSSTEHTTREGDLTENESMKPARFLTILVALLGAFSAAIFMGFGMTSAIDEVSNDFHHSAEEIALQLAATWDDYEMGSRWLHQACHRQNISRQHFRDLYTYMNVSLNVQVRSGKKARILDIFTTICSVSHNFFISPL